MGAILFHAKKFETKFHSFANRPKNIVHETIKGKEEQESKNCVVAFVTIESDDNEKKVVGGICEEIEKMCKEVKRNRVVIAPFAHLSSNLAQPEKGLKIIKEIEKKLKNKLEVVATHFGSNKSLMLSIYGHAGNARYREF